MYLERITPWLTPAIRASIALGYFDAGRPHAEDVVLLRVLHKTHWPRIEKIQETRAARSLFLASLVLLAEGGKIAVVESGRDCDCVDYFGRVHIIDATLEAYNKLYDDTAEWADGPFRFELAKPSEAQGIEYESHDRVLEAFEDGHPHHVYSSFAG